MHYVYPYPHVDEVIPLMAEGKVLPYLDIPFQHGSPTRAEAHAAAGASEKTLERIARGARSARISRCARRSSSAFRARPSRTSGAARLAGEAKLIRVGCFKYEHVDGAAANAFPGLVPDAVKQERYDRLMWHQQAISESCSRGASARPSR